MKDARLGARRRARSPGLTPHCGAAPAWPNAVVLVLGSSPMRTLHRMAGVAVLGALAALPFATAGCSNTPTGKTATVQAGDMPSGADWTGVYFSELYGYLDIVQDGNAVSGKWLRPVKDRWGEIHGSATGDVIHFSWTEHTIGSVGPKSPRSGKGYF